MNFYCCKGIQGFWADSKKFARILSKLLRQGDEITTK